MRTHGQMSMVQLTAAAAGDGFFTAIGIAVCTLDAFTIGITAMPGPISDIDWSGWLFHEMFHVISNDASPAGADALTQVDIKLESKAMRKLGLNDVVFLMVETIEVGTATMEVFGMTRMLLKISGG